MIMCTAKSVVNLDNYKCTKKTARSSGVSTKRPLSFFFKKEWRKHKWLNVLLFKLLSFQRQASKCDNQERPLNFLRGPGDREPPQVAALDLSKKSKQQVSFRNRSVQIEIIVDYLNFCVKERQVTLTKIVLTQLWSYRRSIWHVVFVYPDWYRELPDFEPFRRDPYFLTANQALPTPMVLHQRCIQTAANHFSHGTYEIACLPFATYC